jgi:hypothetical protein
VSCSNFPILAWMSHSPCLFEFQQFRRMFAHNNKINRSASNVLVDTMATICAEASSFTPGFLQLSAMASALSIR